MLARHYALQTLIASGPRAIIGLLLRVPNVDVAISWFGSTYAALVTILAHLTRGISIIVIGGVDVAKRRDIGYGIWLSRWKALFVRYALRHADRVLAVDPALAESAKLLARYDGRNIEYLPTGYDAAEWPMNTGPRDDVVLTVAVCDTPRRLKVKGIDRLLDAARALPEITFRIIGIAPALIDELRESAPHNVDMRPAIARSLLAHEYGRAKVYCQPSQTEGLPNTLCEAMLCGCIPIGTTVGGIPTAIGETGFLVDGADPAGLVRAIADAMAAPEGKGVAAHERIASHFSAERRERGLCAAIDALLDNSR